MLIDLSIKLDQGTPVFPGDPAISLQPLGSIQDDGYALHSLTIGTHAGTHIDAPAHMITGGPTLDQIPLETFKGKGVLISGFDLPRVQAAGLQAGDIAVFATGTSQRFHEPDYFTDYPVMDSAVAEYLVSAGVKLVALDTCSADNQVPYPVHKALLAAGIPIAENLTNVEALQGKDFDILALPLRIDADGAPARIVAEVHDV